jgi:hypothetical protein
MSDEPKSHRDIFIEQQIERQIAPYIGVAPPELLTTMREGLDDVLRTYPPAVAIIDQLVAQAAPLRTEENPLDGEAGGESDKTGSREGA